MYRHRMDVVSLVFGVLYAGVGALLLFGTTVDLDLSAVWPVLLVLAGLALLVSAARNRDRNVTEVPVGTAPPSSAEDESKSE